MNRSRRILLPLLALPLALFAEPGPPAGADPGAVWRAVAASGAVEARALAAASTVDDDGAAWQAVRRGDPLGAHAVVRTGKRGRATLVRTADVMMVDPQSVVELPPAGASADAPVVQRAGSVVYEIDGTVRRGFSVETPHLVAGVKGTVFLVSVTDRHASVTVHEGVVEVTNRADGEVVEVPAGVTAVVEAGVVGSLTVVDGTRPHGEIADDTRRHVRADRTRLWRMLERDAFLRPDDAIVPSADAFVALRDPTRALTAAAADGATLAGDAVRTLTDPVTSIDGTVGGNLGGLLEDPLAGGLLDDPLRGVPTTEDVTGTPVGNPLPNAP